MDLKVIKSSDQYKVVLREAEELVARDPAEGSTDAERLELMTVLIEDYEKRHFPFRSPDPIEAIEFRMSEQGLRRPHFRRDLQGLAHAQMGRMRFVP